MELPLSEKVYNEAADADDPVSKSYPVLLLGKDHPVEVVEASVNEADDLEATRIHRRPDDFLEPVRFQGNPFGQSAHNFTEPRKIFEGRTLFELLSRLVELTLQVVQFVMIIRRFLLPNLQFGGK